ncbi:MAG: sulfotransferase family 2 domain-containing protein [Pseudomonadota bacterium]
MTFSQLKPGRVRAYLDAAREGSRSGDLWVFQHIPKTAGSSLAAELAANRRPYRNLHIGMGSAGGAETALKPDAQRDVVVREFLDDPLSREVRSVSGHLRYANIETLKAEISDMRLFTFVREPVSRVVSEYYYCLSPLHNNPEGFRKAFPTLNDFANSLEASNKMAVYIADRRGIRPDDLVALAFERFDFIGSQKLYGLSFRVLSSLLWYETQSEQKLRVAGSKPSKQALDPETVRTIRQNNRADIALFNAVSDVYRACRDELIAELKRRARERMQA